jgi:hypothetical protein
MDTRKKIDEIKLEIREAYDKIRSNNEQLYDPMDENYLEDQEKKEMKQENIELENKIKLLKNMIINLICKSNPMIENSEILQTINNYETKFLMYELVYKCPELLSNENNMKTIINCSINNYFRMRQLSTSILVDENLKDYLNSKKIDKFYPILFSDILLKDLEIRKILDEYINNDAEYGYFDGISINNIKDLEIILKNIPNVSRKLILGCYNGEYLRKNIDNLKVINDLLLISKLYLRNKNSGFLNKSILSNIFDMFYNPTFMLVYVQSLGKNYSNIDKLKIAILLNTCNEEILDNFMHIAYDYSYIFEDNPDIKIAMLKAPTVNHQNKLLDFLEFDDVKKSINNKGLYYHLLIEEIEKENFQYFGDVKSLFNLDEMDKNLKEKLLHYFDNENLENIYFFIENCNFLCQTPLTFYKQFLQNIFFGGYLEQCAKENNHEGCLFDQEILYNFIDEEYIKMAEHVLIKGKNMPANYNINEEIEWNELMTMAKATVQSDDEYKNKMLKKNK